MVLQVGGRAGRLRGRGAAPAPAPVVAKAADGWSRGAMAAPGTLMLGEAPAPYQPRSGASTPASYISDALQHAAPAAPAGAAAAAAPAAAPVYDDLDLEDIDDLEAELAAMDRLGGLPPGLADKLAAFEALADSEEDDGVF